MPTYISKFGDWTKAGAVLQAMNVHLQPAFRAQIEEDGKLILDTIVGHIDAQDLPWVPLAQQTIELKNGDDTIYVDTGYLRDNLEVRRVRSTKNGVTLFVGASAWKRHPSGEKFSNLMIWLEYGTDKVPARPLIRPSWAEVEPIIKSHWEDLLQDMIAKGGVWGG
jgi:hypothetical protein